MPSLTQLTEGSEALSSLSEGSGSLSLLSEGSATLSTLAELVARAAQLVAGLLPGGSLYPGISAAICSVSTIVSTSLLVGAAGPYPDPNTITPAVEGIDPTQLQETTLTLTPLNEA